MSKYTTATMPPNDPSAAPVQEPGEDAIRDYAFHLYQQGNGAPGHDVEDWLEATACLKAHIPAHASHGRLHRHVHTPAGHAPLFASPALAVRESQNLRRDRESLEAAPSATDTDVRSSLFDDHP